jgi:4-aminobutyrate aminotransferase/(S)-3-amino-2-methylpropionate transaminase
MPAPADVFGEALPLLQTQLPGPVSRALALRLARVESRNITKLKPHPPIFWAEARGANVRDVDGNILLDLTAGFGVATAGHANPRVASAIAKQSARLAHGLGDVHPSEVKLELLEKLAAITPGTLSVSILGSAGAEAVEAALKTAVLGTGRTGVLAFEGSYHGLTYGALATTHRPEFREPFTRQLSPGVRFAPFPSARVDLSNAVAQIDTLLDDSIGAVIVEPIQGRGGIRMPADGFLDALRERCDGRNRMLIFDEIYTGMGRTGRWFACEHWNVVPDVLIVGKGLTGSVPLSAAIGSPEVMAAWPESTGEALHTSTFLGNPIACAAALAQIAQIEELGLIQRARSIGNDIQRALPTRGLGALQGMPARAGRSVLPLCDFLLDAGVIALAEGMDAEVLAITPPLVITDRQLAFALEAIDRSLAI